MLVRRGKSLFLFVAFVAALLIKVSFREAQADIPSSSINPGRTSGGGSGDGGSNSLSSYIWPSLAAISLPCTSGSAESYAVHFYPDAGVSNGPSADLLAVCNYSVSDAGWYDLGAESGSSLVVQLSSGQVDYQQSASISASGSSTLVLDSCPIGTAYNQMRTIARLDSSSSNSLTISTTGGQTINGASTYTIPPNTTVTFYCNGSEWQTPLTNFMVYGPLSAILSSGSNGLITPASTYLGGCVVLTNTAGVYTAANPVTTCTGNSVEQDGGPDPGYPLLNVATTSSSGNAVINYISNGVAMQLTWNPTLLFHERPGTTTFVRNWVGIYAGSQNPDGFDLPQAALVGARCSTSAGDTVYQLCTGNNTVSGTSCVASKSACMTAVTSTILLTFNGTVAVMAISQNGNNGPWDTTRTTTDVPTGVTGGALMFESVTTLTSAIAQTYYGDFQVWQQ